MTFTDERIDEFIDIWGKEFGERLSPDEARIEASRLMELISVLLEPMPGEPDYSDDLDEHRTP